MLIQRSQSGFGLLLFLVVLLSGSVIALSGALNKSIKQQSIDKRIENIKRLNAAKEALLSYAVDYVVDNDMGDIGKLPCPDLLGGANSNGSSDPSCGETGVNSIGYFPYKSVGLGKVEDADGECFWYVVSSNYKTSPVYGLRNWDSNGFLKIVDENGTVQHVDEETDYPIALIISPGKGISQDRTPNVDKKLSDCNANYTTTNYLEGGPNIDYASDLPLTANTEWTFLQPSTGSALNNVNYNDQIVAIYRDELWDKVKGLNDLNELNSNDPDDAALRQLAQDLAECLKAYMEEGNNTNNNAVYPAQLNLTDYSDADLYLTNSARFYGRFPENIEYSELTGGIDIVDTASEQSFVSSYCLAKIPSFEEELWENWKNHFFLVIGEDFAPVSTVIMANKCQTEGECLDIDFVGTRTEAAFVFYGRERLGGQVRELLDIHSDSFIWRQYMDGFGQTLYVGDAATNKYGVTSGDYAYCITYDAGTLTTQVCKE